MSINTNDLRIFADKLAIESDQQYLYAVASELDATRTERNLARSALTAAEARAEAAEARVGELNAQIVWAVETLQEINVSNYDHDDVCRLNDASVEVILGLCAEPTRTLKGATS